MTEKQPKKFKEEFEMNFDIRTEWYSKWCNEESEFHLQNPIVLKRQLLLEALEKARDSGIQKATSIYEEYIALLLSELEELVPLAHVHGWRSSRYKQGMILREKINSLLPKDSNQ